MIKYPSISQIRKYANDKGFGHMESLKVLRIKAIKKVIKKYDKDEDLKEILLAILDYL